MKTKNKEKTCKDRWLSHKDSRISDLEKLWFTYRSGNEKDIEALEEYGLSFDYVAPETFNGQKKAYFRYQISWGGPSEEFRFYVNPDFSLIDIEFWFLDWFDGYGRSLKGEDYSMMEVIFEWFRSIGSVEAEFEKANAQ